MTRGEDAEREVAGKLERALPDPFRVYPNVRWTGPERPGGPAVDGEADLVVLHPDHGILVIEVKAGDPTRDHANRWFLGSVPLDESPFAQAERHRHALARQVAALPAWRTDRRPPAGHAVAFPAIDLASRPRGHVLLGPDVHPEIVLDATALETPASALAWVERAFRFWRGADDRATALGVDGVELIDGFLDPTYTLRRLVRGRIEDDRPLLVDATRHQQQVIRQHRRSRRLSVVGPAGSGKSMLAAAKARALAGEGYRTLLVCFNQALATALRRDLADEPAPAGLTVTTFHRLCELVAGPAGTLPPRPDPVVPAWFDRTLPDALRAAIAANPDDRYHAVIVDEGQDFELEWLELLLALLRDPAEDVFWVFHDPGQSLLRDDPVERLGLPPFELFDNLRNPGPIARLAHRFYRGGEEIVDLRDGDDAGDEVGRLTLIEAADDQAVVEAVRRELHRLTVEEQVRAWDIVILSGRSARESAVWRRRTFGNLVLESPALNDDGTSRGLPPEEVPDESADGGVVLFETSRRYKGLDRPVVILCELPTDGDRLDQLLYSGITRATTALVVIAPPELMARLR